MNSVEIVRRMERSGVTIKLHEGKLQVCADKALTDPQRLFIQDHKKELIHYLKVMDDPNVQEMMVFFDAKVQAIHPNETLLV